MVKVKVNCQSLNLEVILLGHVYNSHFASIYARPEYYSQPVMPKERFYEMNRALKKSNSDISESHEFYSMNPHLSN